MFRLGKTKVNQKGLLNEFYLIYGTFDNHLDKIIDFINFWSFQSQFTREFARIWFMSILIFIYFISDVIIPACSDLVSLTIDIWLKGEETDGERLAVASDIGLRPLVLADLQPPPLCRYLKVSSGLYFSIPPTNQLLSFNSILILI